MLDLAFTQQCANAVPTITTNAIVKQESSFNPYAIGVAGGLKRQPTSYAEAVATASYLISKGYNIDMGLAQINSSNLGKLNLSVRQVFEPCTNVNAMQTIFIGCFNGAKKLTNDNNLAVRMAFSCYNTGDYTKGFRNGYVQKIIKNHDYFRSVIPSPYQYAVSSTPVKATKPVTSQSPIQTINYKSSAPKAEVTPAIAISVKQNAVKSENLDQYVAKNNDVAVASIENPEAEKQKAYHSWDVFKNF